jgi:hypothetical protein
MQNHIRQAVVGCLFLSAVHSVAGPPGLIRVTTNGVVPQHLEIYAGNSVTWTNETPSLKAFNLQGLGTNVHLIVLYAGGTWIADYFGMNSGVYPFQRTTNRPSFNGTITVKPWLYPDLLLSQPGEVYLAPGIHNYRKIKLENNARLRLTGDTTIIAWGPYFGDLGAPSDIDVCALTFIGNGRDGDYRGWVTPGSEVLPGAGGTPGGSGTFGSPGNQLTVIAYGNAIIQGKLNGGNGTHGQDGGDGAVGSGINKPWNLQSEQEKWIRAGPGGQGGSGGQGGIGGNGGRFKLFAAGKAQINELDVSGGTGGNAGAGGSGGPGGVSGYGYLTNSVAEDDFGNTGSSGARGTAGEGGVGGQIDIQAGGIWTQNLVASGGDAGAGSGVNGSRGGDIRALSSASAVIRGSANGGVGGSGADADRVVPSKTASVNGNPGRPGGNGGSGGTILAEASFFNGSLDVGGGYGGGGGAGTDGALRVVDGGETFGAGDGCKGGDGGSGGHGGNGGNIHIQALTIADSTVYYNAAGGLGGSSGNPGDGIHYAEKQVQNVTWQDINGIRVYTTNIVIMTVAETVPGAQQPGAAGGAGTIFTDTQPQVLAVRIDVDLNHAAPGQEITYNIMPRALVDQFEIEVSAAIPSHTYFVRSNGAYDPEQSRMTWTFRSWDNGIAICSFTVRVSEDAPYGARIDNWASIRSTAHPEPVKSEPVVTWVDDGVELQASAYEIGGDGSRTGPIASTSPGATNEWEICIANRFASPLTLENVSARLSNSEIWSNSLQPQGTSAEKYLAWNQSRILPGNTAIFFRFRARVEETNTETSAIVELTQIITRWSQAGQTRQKQAFDTRLIVRQEKLVLSVAPIAIPADGKSYSDIRATLTRKGKPVSGEIIMLQSNPGKLLDSLENPSLSAVFRTDGMGQIHAHLVSERLASKATVEAKWSDLSALAEVEFYEPTLTMDFGEANYTKVPALAFGQTMSVKRQARPNPEVTRFGRTQLSIRIKLTGVKDPAALKNQVIELSSEEKSLAGTNFIQLPEQIVTDAQGEATASLVVDNLWRSQATIGLISVWARLRASPEVADVKAIAVVDNASALLELYQQRIPQGRIWDNEVWDELQKVAGTLINVPQWMVMRASFAGHINNALDSILFDWIPNYWNNQFDAFTCGGYQAAVLNLMSDIHFNVLPDLGQTDWLMNGLDYGPLYEHGGIHVAAMLYPRLLNGDQEWHDPNTWILDPWLEQQPEYYRWSAWLDRIDAKNLYLLKTFPGGYFNITASTVLLPGTLNQYPANGKDYPQNRLAPIPVNKENNGTVVLVNCPVDVTVVDALGRSAGFTPGANPDTIPLADEVPGVSRSQMSADSGTSWFFELPPGTYTITIRPYTNGIMTLLVLQEQRAIRFENIGITNNQTGSLRLETTQTSAPVLRFANQPIIRPTVSPTPPVLHYARAGKKQKLYWADEHEAFQLQVSTNSGPNNWKDLITNTNTLIVPELAPIQFFRLRQRYW